MTQNCFALPSTNVNRYGGSLRKETYERVGRFCYSKIEQKKLVESVQSYYHVYKDCSSVKLKSCY